MSLKQLHSHIVTLSEIVPNLHELDGINVNMSGSDLKSFVKKYPHLEQITWNNVSGKSMVYLNVKSMRLGHEL